MPHDFTLLVELGLPGPDAGDLMGRLSNAGCDDALVGTGRPGYVSLDFTRDAASAAQAIEGAVQAVRRALPEAKSVALFDGTKGEGGP